MFKKMLKEDLWFIISLIIIFVIFNIKLPYYINMPGGTIEINDRIDCDSCNDINGSLNMLYVSETVATIPTYLLSYVIPNWDVASVKEYQISNESMKEINIRNKLMLENSIDSAMYVAYKASGKELEVKDKKHYVASVTISNNLLIGDEILEVDKKKVESISEIKEIINNKEVGNIIDFKVKRNNKEIEVPVEVKEEDNKKMIGVIILSDYVYEANPELNIKFKKSESGSSGGFMMALSMYTKIADDDIVKGRRIAGTGTISMNGTVGEIDGIKYKIMGAAKNNIDIILVPSGNYKEAVKVVKKHKYDMEVVEVKTFDDAIKYLKKNK